MKISGLTQEKLAKKLGVSFVAFNNWINEKSIPRKRAQEQINELYQLYTGQKTIPETELQAKKQLILTKSSEQKNILQQIVKHSDIFDQFVLSLTYNTNSIEGSTLTENETAVVLFQNRTLPNKTLTEHLEAKNHQAALQYLFQYLQNNMNFLDETLILKLHMMLMNGIRDDAGIYRQHGVRIVGTNVPTANYMKIPVIMKQLFVDIQKKQTDMILHASSIHSIFEKIHPFSDGNGRIGRLLMNAMFLKENLPPPIIKQEIKGFYYTALQKSQIHEDHSLLEDVICDALLESFRVFERE